MVNHRPFWKKNYGSVLRNFVRAKLRPALFDAGELEFLRRGNGLLLERQTPTPQLPEVANKPLASQATSSTCLVCSRLSEDELSKLVAFAKEVDRSLDTDAATKIQNQQKLISELKSDLYWAKVKLDRARRIMVLRDSLHSLVTTSEWDRIRVEL